MVEVDAPIAIIGGGIAGAITTLSLLRRNYTNITLYESSPDLTSSTSSVIAGTVSFDRFHRILREEKDGQDAISFVSDVLSLLSESADNNELGRLSSFLANSAKFNYLRKDDIPQIQRRVYRTSHGLMKEMISSFPQLCSVIIGQWCCEIGGDAAEYVEEALNITDACTSNGDSYSGTNTFGAFRLLTDEMCNSVQQDAKEDESTKSGCDDIAHATEQACVDAGHGYQTVDYKYYNMAETRTLVGDFILSDPIQCSIVEQRLTGYVRTEGLFQMLNSYFVESPSVSLRLGCFVAKLGNGNGTNSISVASKCKGKERRGDNDAALAYEAYDAVIVTASVASVPLLEEIDPALAEHLVSIRGYGQYGKAEDWTPTIRRSQRGRAVVFQEAASNKKASYSRATSDGKVKIWGGAYVNASNTNIRPPYNFLGDDARADIFAAPPAAEISQVLYQANVDVESCVRPVPSLGPLPLIKQYEGEWSNLYLNTGYGFNGYDLCWFSSDCVVSMLVGEKIDDTCYNAQFGQMMGRIDSPSHRWNETSSDSTSLYFLSLALAILLMSLILVIYMKKENQCKSTCFTGGHTKEGADNEGIGGCPRHDFAELTYICALSQTQRSFSPPGRRFIEFLSKFRGDANDLEGDDVRAGHMARGMFSVLDKDSSGFLDREKVLMSSKHISEHDLFHLDGKMTFADNLIENYDINGDGLIDIDEFTLMIRQAVKNTENSSTVRSSCTVFDTDICLFLQSRYNINVDTAGVRRHILPGLSTVVNGNNKLDLAELTAIILIPTLLKTARAEYGEKSPSNHPSHERIMGQKPCPSEHQNVIERVLSIALRDIGFDNHQRYPVLDKHVLRRILAVYGERELASDDELLDDIISVACGGHPAAQSGPVLLTPSTFAWLLTYDVKHVLNGKEDLPQPKSPGNQEDRAFNFSTSVIDSTAVLFKFTSVHTLLWIFVTFIFVSEWLYDSFENDSFIQSGAGIILSRIGCQGPEESSETFGCKLWQQIVFWFVRSLLMIIVGFIAVWGGSLGNNTGCPSFKKTMICSVVSIAMLLLVGALPFYKTYQDMNNTAAAIFYSQMISFLAIATIIIIYIYGSLPIKKGSLSEEASLSQNSVGIAAAFKAERMVATALNLHDSIQATARPGRRISTTKLVQPNALNNVLLKFQSLSLSNAKMDDMDMFRCWGALLSGRLFRQDGIRISSRFLAINAMQLFVSAVILLLGVNIWKSLHSHYEEGKQEKLIYDILTQLLRSMGLSVGSIGNTVCEGAKELSQQFPEELSQQLSKSASDQGLSCEATVQSTIESFLSWMSIWFSPYEVSVLTAPLVLTMTIAAIYTLFLASILIPSIVSTTLQFRNGSIGLFDNPDNFEVYRDRLDRPYELLGTMLWTTVLGPFVFGGIWGVLLFLVLWHVTQKIMFRIIASLMGITITFCLRWAFGLLFVDTAIRGFYRDHVNRFNLCGLAIECMMIGLGIALAAFRAFVCGFISMMYIGRADKILFDSKITIGLGHRLLKTRDHLPVSFRKQILLQEAHRHPYIEVLGEVYKMKLRHHDGFASRSGCCMRLVFTQALMPWLRRWRQVARRNMYPTAVHDGSDRDSEEQDPVASCPAPSSPRQDLGSLRDNWKVRLGLPRGSLN